MAKNPSANQIKPEAAAPAAPAAPEAAAPEAAIETAQPAKVRVRAVHGAMIHPYMPEDKSTIDTGVIAEFDEIDSWLQSQIDAMKIEVV